MEDADSDSDAAGGAAALTEAQILLKRRAFVRAQLAVLRSRVASAAAAAEWRGRELEWWAANAGGFAVEFVAAVRLLLAVPASEADVERMFWTSKRIITPLRTSMAREHMDACVCLARNLKKLGVKSAEQLADQPWFTAACKAQEEAGGGVAAD